MITVSQDAKQYLEKTMQEQNMPADSFIRIGVKGGGCSGLEYDLKFDTAIHQGDEIYEDQGIKIVADLKSLLYVYGTQLDYSGGLNGKGLFFNNPNASRTCSCGESFAV